MPEPARIAIDLGAESCRVSLLRWSGGQALHRSHPSHSQRPVHRGIAALAARNHPRRPRRGSAQGSRKSLPKALPPLPSTVGRWTTFASPRTASPSARPSVTATSAPSPPRKPRTRSPPWNSFSRTGAQPSASTPSTNCWPTRLGNRPACSLGHAARVCSLLAGRPPRGRVHQRHPHRPRRLKTGDWDRASSSNCSESPSTPRRPSSAPEPSWAA
jgi:hypothetical protein